MRNNSFESEVDRNDDELESKQETEGKDINSRKFDDFIKENVRDTISIEGSLSRQSNFLEIAHSFEDDEGKDEDDGDDRYAHFRIKSAWSSMNETAADGKITSKSYICHNPLRLESSSDEGSQSYSDSLDSKSSVQKNNIQSHNAWRVPLLDLNKNKLLVKNENISENSMIAPFYTKEESKYKIEETQDATPECFEKKSTGSLSYSDTPESNCQINDYDFLSQYLDKHIKLKNSLEGRNANMEFELEINATELSHLKEENKELDKLI